MFRDFLSNNSRSLLIISILIVGWGLLYTLNRKDDTEKKLKNPKVGQVYIFKNQNEYAPMRLDSISNNELFMRNYLFLFADAIPKQNQILAHEFDSVFYAIYKKTEMNRLFTEGNLIRIYGDNY